MNRLKIVNASQGIIRQYENVQRKLLFCKADIYFNQQCQHKSLSNVCLDVKPTQAFNQNNAVLRLHFL
jgi:hypothetical protein